MKSTKYYSLDECSDKDKVLEKLDVLADDRKIDYEYVEADLIKLKDLSLTIKENKDFKNLYLFYEEIENKYIEDKEIAKLYVEGIGSILRSHMIELQEFCNSLDNKINIDEFNENQLYSSLDQLMEADTLSNIEKKVIAKKKLVEHLTTKKDVNESKQVVYSQNENLLHAVLANNFNVLYSNTLSESQQEELKNILSNKFKKKWIIK
mgnify:CR=1 FL=1